MIEPTITLHAGDNRVSLRRLIDEGVRVHSVVCDPPYGLTSITKRFGKGSAAPALSNGATGVFKRSSGGFMGQQWDGSGIERDPEFWKLIHDILLPGGYVLAFSSPRTGHWQACAMEMAGFIMHPFFGWTYGCLDPETECLTRRGWLQYTDLIPTDEVMQWDSESGALSWVKPSKVHEYPFDGNMVMIENRHTRQMLTPNHRVYAKVRRHGRHPKPTDYEVLDASTVGARPGNWSVDLPMAGQLRTGFHVDVDYAYLVGWWMTDAWPHKDANACMFSQSKPKTLAKLRTALEPYGASEYVKTSKVAAHADEHTFYLTGEMADRLRAEFPTRELGWDVLNWSQVARKALYEGLMDGDGSRKEDQHAEAFWSQKQERRDVFVALALSLGYRAYDDGKKGVVYVNDKTSTTQVQGKHKTRYVPHTGKVWCLTVPTGAFVARREGRPFITGNSGFPKAHNAEKALEKTGSPEAAQWEGWAYGAQSMKPALEPVYFGQKPFSEKNGALNLLKHGVGAVNIDATRVTATATSQCSARSNLRDSKVCTCPSREGYPNDHSGDSYNQASASLRPEPDANLQPNVREHGHEYLESLDSLFDCPSEHRSYDAPAQSAEVLDQDASPSQRDDDTSLFRCAECGHIRADLSKPSVVNTTPNVESKQKGRHPANLIHDGSDDVKAMFPDTGKSGVAVQRNRDGEVHNEIYGAYKKPPAPDVGFNDSGSASRFFNGFPFEADPLFYHAKATKADRAGSKHPTVKPVALMQHFVRLVTPPGGTVLDPFGGSGTTAEAARREGFDCILMEADDQYVADIRTRFNLPFENADEVDFANLFETPTSSTKFDNTFLHADPLAENFESLFE